MFRWSQTELSLCFDSGNMFNPLSQALNTHTINLLSYVIRKKDKTLVVLIRSRKHLSSQKKMIITWGLFYASNISANINIKYPIHYFPTKSSSRQFYHLHQCFCSIWLLSGCLQIRGVFWLHQVSRHNSSRNPGGESEWWFSPFHHLPVKLLLLWNP